MKRIAVFLMAFLVFATHIALADEIVEILDDAEELAFELLEDQSLVVGNTTPMRGEFFTDLWGNATSDSDVRDLLHGYDLIIWDAEYGAFTTDPTVVRDMTLTVNEAGDHTYTMDLFDDLYYSDGTRITAWDYAFSYLFSIAPELEDIGARPLRWEQIVGYEEYITAKENVEEPRPLAGVRVLADNVISVTLRHEFLPFFYEMGLLICRPYPISVIAPGVEARDDGQGVYLAKIDETIVEPIFTSELLAKTVMDPDTGYLSHPSVVSGPYTLVSWDGVTAEFELNPWYKGNARGKLPIIEHLTYTLALNDTMMDQLQSGEFGLLNKATRADQILDGIQMIQEEEPLEMSNYPRCGLSYISFAGERETVSSQAVRQAIAWCLDRDQVVTDYTNLFGTRVDGYYGIGQWMYGVIAGTVAPPVEAPADPNDAAAQAQYTATLAAFEELSLDGLTAYSVDTNRAAQLLEADGWRLNEDGLREKDGVVLDLLLIYPEGNNVNESFEVNLVPYLEEVGIRLTMEAVPMADLLTRWYKQGERDADMIYLATNFDLVFDPTVHFGDDLDGWSYTNIWDEALYSEALAMRETEPGDVLNYMQHWVAFQERFNTVLPMLPVYSNVYFDFFTDTLQEYEITESITWSQAIIGAFLGVAAEIEEAEEDEFLDNGEPDVINVGPAPGEDYEPTPPPTPPEDDQPAPVEDDQPAPVEDDRPAPAEDDQPTPPEDDKTDDSVDITIVF